MIRMIRTDQRRHAQTPRRQTDRDRAMTETLFDVASAQIHGSAILSEDGAYRYSLARWWDTSKPRDMWVMCNPSTADAAVNDATIRRCIGFSQSFGSGGFVVVNAYAYRATKPATMWAARAAGTDIIGPENDGWITAHCATERGRVIVAWGAHPEPTRCRAIAALIRAQGRDALCLGTTRAGMPRHPLMLPNAAELTPWAALGGAA